MVDHLVFDCLKGLLIGTATQKQHRTKHSIIGTITISGIAMKVRERETRCLRSPSLLGHDPHPEAGSPLVEVTVTPLSLDVSVVRWVERDSVLVVLWRTRAFLRLPL